MPSEYFQKKVISNWCQKFNFSNLTVAGNPQNNISTCLSCKGKLGNHKNHHFKSFIAKTNESIFHKGSKNLFLGPFWLLFQKIRFFQKYCKLPIISAPRK